MFTFVMITYNQEEFVIEHLESIKYQIKNYGSGTNVNLVISDDCSKDNTLNYIELWLKYNKGLFHKITILKNKKNVGVVTNYLRATEKIETPFYKLLAGDDLYYMNNVFENKDILIESEFIITPTIRFNSEGIKKSSGLAKLLYFQNIKKIKTYMKFDNPFEAPGLFFSTSLMHEVELREYLSKYTWIEDLPTIYYLLKIRDDIKYVINYTPYVLYRSSVGISTNRENLKHYQFLEEEKCIKNEIGMHQVIRGFNINYIKSFAIRRYISLLVRLKPYNWKLLNNIKKEEKKAFSYYNIIRENAINFIEQTNKEE